MSATPVVSVLVPTYNGERFLAGTLASIHRQSYENLRILVRDDGSTDATIDIARSFAAVDARIDVIEGGRGGALANMSTLMRMADGDFVKICCQDDLLDATCVERLLAPMLTDSTVTLATSVRRLIDEEGNLLAGMAHTVPLVDADDVLDGTIAARRTLLFTLNQIGEPSTTLFRNGLFDPQAPFRFRNTQFDVNADVALWLTLLSQGNLFYAAEPLSSFRMHSRQRSADSDVLVAGSMEWAELLRCGIESGLVALGPQSIFGARNVIDQLQGLIDRIMGSDAAAALRWVGELSEAVTRTWQVGIKAALPGLAAA